MVASQAIAQKEKETSNMYMVVLSLSLSLVLVIASAGDYGYAPKPNVEKPKPEEHTKLDIIGIQGLILCKSPNNVVPLKGAVARITCLAEDDQGYEGAPFSILSQPCDAKGYFFARLSRFDVEDNMKLKECKAFLESSPMESCDVPTDENNGIGGALLTSYRIINEKKMKLYSLLEPFIYTSEQQQPAKPTEHVPNGGY